MPDQTMNSDGNGLPEITNNKTVFILLKDRRMKLRLLESMRIRNLDILTRVLADARDGGYSDRMRQEYDDAKLLHEHLTRISVLRRDIVNLSKTRFAETQSYTRPPEPLQKLLTAVFALLGEMTTDLTWKKLRHLLYQKDKNSLLERVGRFNVNQLTPEAIADATEIMRDVKRRDIEMISNVATLLLAWVKHVLRAVNHIAIIKKKYFQKELEEEKSKNVKYIISQEKSKETYSKTKKFSKRQQSQEEDGLTTLRIRENIQKITRGQLSELQAYGHPPITIQRVMRATFTVLGENPAELEWHVIRKLMNKTDSNSIVRRVGAFQIADLQMGAKQYAEETLDGLTWHDVKSVSSAAALFYSWVKCVIREADNPRKWHNVRTFIKDDDDVADHKNDGCERPKIDNGKDGHSNVDPTPDIVQFQKEITKMTRIRITEVHSYSNPPVVVEKVMKAIFAILGEPFSNLTWKKLRGLMSRMDKRSLTKRIENFRIRDLTAEGARVATQLLDELTFQKVQTVSNVAATFFAWGKYVLTTWKNKTASTVNSNQASQTRISDGLDDVAMEADSDEDMKRIRAEITKMSRGRISEIHAYSRPPITIEKVMRAVFTILGESPGGLDWKKIRGLMCRMDKNSLIRRVEGFQISELHRDVAEIADVILSDLTLQGVRSVSNVAATLYAWAKCIVKDAHQYYMSEENIHIPIPSTTSIPRRAISKESSTKSVLDAPNTIKLQPALTTSQNIPILTKAEILRTTSNRRHQQSTPDSDSSSTKENKRSISNRDVEIP